MLDYIDMPNLESKARYYTHFFDKGAKRFFNSRLADTAYIIRDVDGTEHAYFTTSERFDSDTPRYYSVRVLHMIPGKDHWQTTTMGEFQQYKTKASAHKAMLALIDAHDKQSGAKDNESFYKTHYALRDSNYAARNAEANNNA